MTDFYTPLEELHETSPHVINGTALIGVDGTLVASTLPSSFDVDTLTAIVSSTMQVGGESIQEFGHKQLKQMLLKSQKGFILLRNIADKLILFVVANERLHPAIFLPNVQDTAEKVADLLAE